MAHETNSHILKHMHAFIEVVKALTSGVYTFRVSLYHKKSW